MKTISFETYLLMQASLMSAQRKDCPPSVAATVARIEADAILRLNKAEVEKEIPKTVNEFIQLAKKERELKKCNHMYATFKTHNNKGDDENRCSNCGELI